MIEKNKISEKVMTKNSKISFFFFFFFFGFLKHDLQNFRVQIGIFGILIEIGQNTVSIVVPFLFKNLRFYFVFPKFARMYFFKGKMGAKAFITFSN